MDRIDSWDDRRIEAYRNLRDRTLRGENLFVAEGPIVARRLLESRFEVESVLLCEAHAEEFAPLAANRNIPLYVAPEALLSRIAGFPFHLGVLAAGRRRPLPSLHQLVAPPPLPSLRILILPEVTKPENLGLAVRSAAAFGLDAVLLGARCCDPLSRRALRVSMGTVLQTPLGRSEDLAADLLVLKHQWQVALVAAVLEPGARPLSEVCWPPRAAVLVGNEWTGLASRWLALCDQRVTIPMHPGVDSLNLGVAAGIFLYEMTRSWPAGCSPAPAVPAQGSARSPIGTQPR